MKSTPTLLAAALLATGAQAHVTLEVPTAVAGEPYKAVLRVGHGCEGTATHTLVVALPPGFAGARPMPKPGWTLTLRREGGEVVEITWKAAGREAWLDPAHYDEFVLRGRAPRQPGPAWFKVQQLCEKGSWHWAETPPEGSSTRGLRAPAALLDVQPAAAAAAQHHHH